MTTQTQTSTPIDMIEPPAPKHTPWTYDHATRTVRGTDGKNVCLVSEAASGHLLAAAPELLAEAREALRGLQCASTLASIINGGDDTPAPSVERLAAIIAKAEGRHE